jgi:multiple sugar transport system substrate-binding protein
MKAKSLWMILVLALTMLLVACGGTTEQPANTPAATEAVAEPTEEAVVEEPTEEAMEEPTEEAVVEEPTEEAVEEPTEEAVVAEPTANPDASGKIEIRWYVGLGAGTDAPVIEAQQQVVDEFNASQDEIFLVLEVVDNDNAYDVLNTQIAAGNPPDIVGPMGIRGRASFPGAWLDLAPLIESTGYDLSDFDPALVEFYQLENEGQVGIPFAIYPSFLYVNKDLFDEAGLPYPPQEYGAPYIDENGEEKEWNMETLRELSLKLTVDANGNDATSPDFDPEQIVQFGFGNQWTDLRGQATFFGSGNLVDADGNAAMPDHWRDAIKWYYDGMWTSHFYPNSVYGNSE